MLLQAHIVS